MATCAAPRSEAVRTIHPPVLARGDDPPEPPAVLARGDDPPEPPAVLAGRAARALFESVARMLRDPKRCPLIVHRQRALFSSWYEFFPRSEGARVSPLGRRKPVSGTFATAARRLDAVASMGFDVVYLPPIHPIGTTARKGKNNALF